MTTLGDENLLLVLLFGRENLLRPGSLGLRFDLLEGGLALGQGLFAFSLASARRRPCQTSDPVTAW